MSITALAGMVRYENRQDLIRQYTAQMLYIVARQNAGNPDAVPLLSRVLDPPKEDRRTGEEIIQEIIRFMEQ